MEWTETTADRSTYSLSLFPGMLLKKKDGSIILVGDLNSAGGKCDCCRDSAREIVAYSLTLRGIMGLPPVEIVEDPYGTDSMDDED